MKPNSPQHPAFLQRPNYRAVRQQPLPELRQEAAAALRAGWLNINTLWLHRCCYLRSQAPKDFLQYLVCRRQLGYSASPQRQRQLQQLINWPWWRRWLKGIRRHRFNQLCNLFYETKQLPHSAAQKRGPDAQQAASWLAQQKDWQASWQQAVKQARSIHVVGNSPQLLEQQQGAEIDAAGLVIRFNHFASEHTPATCIGERTSAWVIAPGYDGPRFDDRLEDDNSPIILAGPAMLHWQQRFRHLLDGSFAPPSAPVLQIPLSTWRKAVRQFAAPPSAGALTILWLLELNKQPVNTIRLFGFGYAQAPNTRYHVAKPTHQPVSRHNWQAEQQWLRALARSTPTEHSPTD